MIRRARYFQHPWRGLVLLTLLATIAAGMPGRTGWIKPALSENRPALPAAEFSRLIQEFSEEGGYFHSDNFTSNETSYLTVVDRLRQLNVSGGAYIGVGPEQNLSYIARIRPQIAFIVDIRRQAMIQHLLYKAIVHQSATRAEFLSMLLSRPITGRKQTLRNAPISELAEYFSKVPASDESFSRNLDAVRKRIGEEFKMRLSESDQASLEYVYRAFRDNGMQLSFRFGSSVWSGYGRFPSLADLLTELDPRGRPGSFLASEDDYRFVRRLHLQNRIIPIVGNFAGSKALSSVGNYLTQHRYVVRAFYTSNVEQFLFRENVFDRFVANVRKLPIDDRSVIIRAVARSGQPHPASQPGQRTITLLQKAAVFLDDQSAHLYPSYWDLITTHYIAGGK